MQLSTYGKSTVCTVLIAGIAALCWLSTSRAAPPPCVPLGPQHALVMAVNFPSNPTESKPIEDIHDDFFGATDSLQDYWEEASYGQTTLTGDALGWFTLDFPGWESCNVYDIQREAVAMAAQQVDVTQYNRLFIRMQRPPECATSWAGLGGSCGFVTTPSGELFEASTAWNFTDSLGVIIHEGGHNLGLGHANSEDHGVDTAGPIGVTGTTSTYGNIFDVMGQSFRTGHHNAAFKKRLGFITDSAITQVNSSGTYTIEPISVASTGAKSLRIFRGAYLQTSYTPPRVQKEYFWIETRKEVGYDANIRRTNDLAYTAYGGAIVHMERGNFSLGRLLDTHPNSLSTATDFYDAPMVAGETFTDPYTGISITHDGVSQPDGNVTLTVNIANPDTDEDGVSNADENTFGTDPNNEHSDSDTLTDFFEVCYDGDCTQYNPGVTDLDATASDTDSDGMADDWELTYSLDPLVDDSAADGDADGLTNLQEFQQGTKPNVADTDRDNLSDGDEVNIHGTDPLDAADTDMDGVPDDWENVHGTNAASDDGLLDPDGDGVLNVIEYQRLTLPNDANSTPVIQALYVDAANTGGDGSQLNPYDNLSIALSLAQHGDTIHIASGNYTVSTFVIQRSINLLGPSDRSAVINASVTYQTFSLWGEISGITLVNNGLFFMSDVHNVEYVNDSIQSQDGMLLGRSYNISIRNSVIRPWTAGLGQGIRFQLDNSLEVINTTIAGFDSGLFLSGVATDPGVVMRNCILDNTNDLSNFTDTSNITFNLISDGSVTGINGNITGSPQFVDEANGDYHLLPGSVAIDAGDPNNLYGNEPENNGDRINMGAFGNTSEASSGNDSDGDGLTDQNESCYDSDCGNYDPYHPTTNPSGTDLDYASADTDGDGSSDSNELMYGSDPIDELSLPTIVADGDVNLDGQVNVADVLLAQRYVLGLGVLSQGQIDHGDVYPPAGGDGLITLSDVLLITQQAFQ